MRYSWLYNRMIPDNEDEWIEDCYDIEIVDETPTKKPVQWDDDSFIPTFEI